MNRYYSQTSHDKIRECKARRKSTLKKFRKKNNNKEMHWENGKLVFSDTKEIVPGSPTIMKPEKSFRKENDWGYQPTD